MTNWQEKIIEREREKFIEEKIRIYIFSSWMVFVAFMIGCAVGIEYLAK